MYPVKELITAINARITALCAGETWSTEKGDLVAMQVFVYRRPQPTDQADSSTSFPFTIARHLGGDDEPGDGRTTIRLVCGTHCPSGGDYVDGEEELDRLLAILKTLPTNQNENGYTPYSLEKITYRKGADSGGIYDEYAQPHPEYYMIVDLHFLQPSAFYEE